MGLFNVFSKKTEEPEDYMEELQSIVYATLPVFPSEEIRRRQCEERLRKKYGISKQKTCVLK